MKNGGTIPGGYFTNLANSVSLASALSEPLSNMERGLKYSGFTQRRRFGLLRWLREIRPWILKLNNKKKPQSKTNINETCIVLRLRKT